LVTSTALGATFDLLGLGSNLPTPLVLKVEGIQLSLAGGLGFNSSSTSFGIDGIDSGGFIDDPNLIDGDETLHMILNHEAFLESITISHFDAQDSGELRLQSVVSIPLHDGVVEAGDFRLVAHSTNHLVISTIGAVAGGTRGFSLDKITVRAIPEPAAVTVGMIGLLCLALNRRM
jgi:hypothetical protein